MAHEPLQPEDRALWQRFCRAAIDAPETHPPALLELAGYLDGLLEAEDHERVEAALAAHPELLVAVCETRAIVDDGPGEAAPPQLRAAVVGLVPTVPTRSSFRFSDWRTASRWVAAAAASLLVCVVAYRLGTSAVPSAERDAFDLVTEASFGALDGSADDEDYFAIALATGGVGP